MIIQPLRPQFKIDYKSMLTPQEQIQQRVNSEDNYTNARGYPLIKSKDIKGKWGNPV